MDMLAVKIVLLAISTLIGIFVAVYLSTELLRKSGKFLSKLTDRLAVWLEKHEKVKARVTKVKNGLIIVFGIWILISFASVFVDIAKNYKTPHQKRLEFLEEHCEQVDVGYETLNNGKSIYKCPNGKEYKE